MRVENGFTIWNCLSGKSSATQNFEELFEIGLRPNNVKSGTFDGPQRLQIQDAVASACKENANKPQKNVYRPPGQRGLLARGGDGGARTGGGTGEIQAMMRGDVPISSPRQDKINKAEVLSIF